MALALLLLLGCGGATKEHNSWSLASSDRWAGDAGLQNVECVVFDESIGVLYASSGKDYKPGIDGFISKISQEGEVISLRWVDSLSRPTGMDVLGSMLFVADVNALVSVDTQTGAVIERYDEPIEGSGLNDVTVDEEGTVYVSASAIGGVYRLEDGVLKLWVQDEERLVSANGLEAAGDQILVAGMRLSSVNRNTREIAEVPMTPKVVDFEGIVRETTGGYFLTTVENSALYFLNPEGAITKLSDGQDYLGDFDFVREQPTLYLATGSRNPARYGIARMRLKWGNDL